MSGSRHKSLAEAIERFDWNSFSSPIETNLAWAAGLFDGEGSTCLSSSGDKNTIAMSLYQNNRDTLQRFKAVVQRGEIYGPYQRKGPNPIYCWKVGGFERTVETLTALWPYLTLQKRTQAVKVLELYLEYYRGRHG